MAKRKQISMPPELARLVEQDKLNLSKFVQAKLEQRYKNKIRKLDDYTPKHSDIDSDK